MKTSAEQEKDKSERSTRVRSSKRERMRAVHSRLCSGTRKVCDSSKEEQRGEQFCALVFKQNPVFIFREGREVEECKCQGLLDFRAKHNRCTGVDRPTTRQVSSSSTGIVFITANPRIAGKVVQHQLKAAEGINVSHRMV